MYDVIYKKLNLFLKYANKFLFILFNVTNVLISNNSLRIIYFKP